MEKLRVSNSRLEISHVLKTMMNDMYPVMIWQKRDDEPTRRKSHGKVNNLNFENRTISVIPLEDSFDEFVSFLPLYCKSEASGLLFKSEKLEIKKGVIIFPMPKEVHLHELRGSDRYEFPRSKTPTVEVIQSQSSLTPRSKLSVSLTDITPEGAGLIISKKNTHLFEIGDDIKLLEVNDKRIRETMIGQIVHKTTVKSRKSMFRGNDKLGIKFRNTIDLEKFFNFMNEA